MTIDEAYKYVENNNPEAIHISGKTCVGKTTFSNRLVNDFDYDVIPLDNIVLRYVVDSFELSDVGNVFIEVYKNRDKAEWIKAFIEGVQKEVQSSLNGGKKVIIDGAVANVVTLKELIKILPSCVIVYLHPSNLNNYQRNLVSRFNKSSKLDKAGLPLSFWEQFDRKDLSQFYVDNILTPELLKSIESYALESKNISNERLEAMQSQFNDVLVVNI